ncbi:hypothetical protein AMTRI_Chr12g242240 [Amborella trichopoda]
MLRPTQPVHQMASYPSPQSNPSLAIYSTPRPTSSPLIPPQPPFPPWLSFFPPLWTQSPRQFSRLPFSDGLSVQQPI